MAPALVILIVAAATAVIGGAAKVGVDKANERSAILTGNARPEPRGFGRAWDAFWQQTAANHVAARERQAEARASNEHMTMLDRWNAGRNLARQQSLRLAGLKSDEAIERAGAIHRMRVDKIRDGIDPDTDQPLPIGKPVPKHLRNLVKEAAKRVKQYRSGRHSEPVAPLPDVDAAETITPAPDVTDGGPSAPVDPLGDVFDSAPKDTVAPPGLELVPTPDAPLADTPVADATPAVPAAPATPDDPPAGLSDAERMDRLKEARERVDDFKSGKMTRLDRKPNGEDAAVLLNDGLTDEDKALADWVLQPHPGLDREWKDAKEDEPRAIAEAAVRKGLRAGAVIAADRAAQDARETARRALESEAGQPVSREVADAIASVEAVLAEAPDQFTKEGMTTMTGEIHDRESAKAFAASVQESIDGITRYREHLEGEAAVALKAVEGFKASVSLCENASRTAAAKGMTAVSAAVAAMGARYGDLATYSQGINERATTDAGKISDFTVSLNAELAKLLASIEKQDLVADTRQGVGTEHLADDKALDYA